MDIRKKLESLAEPGFQTFMAKLIPNISKERMLGVRLPKLRVIAKELVKEDWRKYLEEAEDNSFEEVMLQGIVIGYAKQEVLELFDWIAWFVPKIDNWSVCDSFCVGLKAAKIYQAEFWAFIQPYLKSKRAYEIRFGVVMFLDYYVNSEYIKEGLKLLDEICHKDYYVKMAVAWAVSICYVKFPKETMVFLKQNHLDDFTYHKALQKITESLKVPKEEKQLIRSMRRK